MLGAIPGEVVPVGVAAAARGVTINDRQVERRIHGQRGGDIKSGPGQARFQNPTLGGGHCRYLNAFLISLIDAQLASRGISVDSWYPGSALAGSALLALEAAGVDVTESVIARIQQLTS